MTFIVVKRIWQQFHGLHVWPISEKEGKEKKGKETDVKQKEEGKRMRKKKKGEKGGKQM